MAIQKRVSTLRSSQSEADKAEREARRMEMLGVGEKSPVVKKSKSKAKTIADSRPMQVSIHFSMAEKRLLQRIKERLEDEGVVRPTVEDIVHNAVTEWVKTYISDIPVEQFDNIEEQDFGSYSI